MSVFLDTSVILAGLVDFGPQSAPAQSLMHAVAEKRVHSPATAWHCCLEFYSVATRLPPEFRVSAADAVTLLEDEKRSFGGVLDDAATRLEYYHLVLDRSIADLEAKGRFRAPALCGDAAP